MCILHLNKILGLFRCKPAGINYVVLFCQCVMCTVYRKSIFYVYFTNQIRKEQTESYPNKIYSNDKNKARITESAFHNASELFDPG